MSASTSHTSPRDEREVAGQLATELRERGLDLAQLQARINAISDREELLLTEPYLEEIEQVRTATTEIADVVARARDRAIQRGVTMRWAYKRLAKATDLTTSRIGQIAPRRR
jgi:hypothetical protein